MANRWLGLSAVLISLIILFLWIPNDVSSGIVEKVRRDVRLGDAFAPSVAAMIVGLGGLLLIVSESTVSKTRIGQRPATDPAGSDSLNRDAVSGKAVAHLRFAFTVLLIVTAALLIMRYTGEFIVDVLVDGDTSYRLLRDTPPWKYLGFFAGGTLMVTSLTAWVERRFRWHHLLIGSMTSLVLIGLYDLPFEDLLLPPNGDV